MDSTRCSGPYWKVPAAPGTNQIAGFVEFDPPADELKKDKLAYRILFFSKIHVEKK